MDYWVFRSRPVGYHDGGGFVFEMAPVDGLIGDPPLYLVSADLADELEDYGYICRPLRLAAAQPSGLVSLPDYRELDTRGRTAGVDDAAVSDTGELVVSSQFLAWALPFGLDTARDFPAWSPTAPSEIS